MLEQRLIGEEMMDDPALPAATYDAVLKDLAQVNRVTLAHRPTLAFLDRALGSRTSFSLLDVGYGHGDMLRTIARWARQKGVCARLVGIDLNPRSAKSAADCTPPGLPIDYRTGDYAQLDGEDWDFVVSSLVAHHMTHHELVSFVGFMESEARCGWFVNDLERSRFAYAGYPLLARLMGWHPIVRHDGRMSIARSYRREEWPSILAEAGAEAASVRKVFPFRLCVERIR